TEDEVYPLDISLYSRTTGEKIQPRSGYSVKITLPVPAKLIDVREGVWYYSAVRFVAQNGLMNGTGKNTFSPQAAANRGMIVAILHKLSGSEETLQSSFRDVVSGAYYAKGVAWAQKNDIVAGYGNGLFGPEDSITREQMITILWKFAGLPAADTTSLLLTLFLMVRYFCLSICRLYMFFENDLKHDHTSKARARK
ncbi:MAG: S-layer homology domain-containing protein, partial [Bacillota bacterium]|nr:S-layer homology domain-containing protein [Bacillota bacterium]